MTAALAMPGVLGSLSPAAFGQPFPQPTPAACAAPAASSDDERLAAKIAAAESHINDRKPVAWSKLADLAQYACAVGDRSAVDSAFRHCFRDCVDKHDVYLAHVYYATTLERFGDTLGAENQFIDALTSESEPTEAFAAYSGYAGLLERQSRPREALDLLNRLPASSVAALNVFPLKLALMRKLGMELRGVAPPVPPRAGTPPSDSPAT